MICTPTFFYLPSLLKMTIFNDRYVVLYCRIYLNITNYYRKMAGTKTVPTDRPPERLYICTNCVWHHVRGTQSIICGIDHFC
jgi:hypothetical protein